MFPAAFDYHRATSLEEALDFLGRHPGAKLLAGGHSLIPMLKLRLAEPPALVDIGRIPGLTGVSRDGGALRIGALTPHRELAASGLLRRECPLLAEAAAEIGDPQVRNRGTIGGNLAHADPASDLPGVALALEATLHLVGPGGERRLPAAEFFVGLLATALASDEILTAIEVPVAGPRTGSVYLKREHPASGYAVCGAAAVVRLATGGGAEEVRLAFNGVAPKPFRATEVEAALAGRELTDEALTDALGAFVVEDPLGDLYASGEYRVELARTWGRRALGLARDRARG